MTTAGLPDVNVPPPVVVGGPCGEDGLTCDLQLPVIVSVDESSSKAPSRCGFRLVTFLPILLDDLFVEAISDLQLRVAGAGVAATTASSSASSWSAFSFIRGLPGPDTFRSLRGQLYWP